MIGVYCLANDVVYEQFLAFVKSFREYNPVLPLTVIRFDEKTENISAISEKYNFKIWNHDLEQELEEIGSRFEPKNKTLAKLFKKFSVFWGEYDTFLFWDSDVIIVDNLSPILESFSRTNSDILYLDTDINFAYNPGSLRDIMIRENGAVHMNTGGFGSKKGAVSIEEIRTYMLSFDAFKDELWNIGEQPFLNYCFDIKKLEKIRIDKLIPEKSFAAWYNINIKRIKKDFYWMDTENNGRMIAVHWAGLNFRNYHTHETAKFFLYFRLLGESPFKKFRYFLNFYHIRTVELFRNRKLSRLLVSLLLSK